MTRYVRTLTLQKSPLEQFQETVKQFTQLHSVKLILSLLSQKAKQSVRLAVQLKLCPRGTQTCARQFFAAVTLTLAL